MSPSNAKDMPIMKKLTSQQYTGFLLKHLILSKKNHKMKVPKKSNFLKYVSRLKTTYKKTIRFTQCIVQVDMRLCKKKGLEKVQY